ncbi:NAD(P)H-hydrate dehydratase [Arcobacter sp. FWKO B]|uniref:NAD(P)H-hydrate dehydratase n=1 Tax=Arcobacter sp. FWKO B TaxID=2593672 RepID=UPI0018A42DDC|nr:NAD(P)H-hydrate dehydratase [Arcobacter sp. FWKO B]QOG12122.1 NAD(P)H-hydrate dehydratase [Arcobacter sp. FWKO B]
MKKVYKSVEKLDKKCYEKYDLSEDLLQEHAALGMYNHIKSLPNIKTILIVSGSGNNGADGMALARLADEEYNVTLVTLSEPKTTMAKLQLQRAKNLGIDIQNSIELRDYDVVVDAIFGTGLNKELSDFYINAIEILNNINGYKIACDIPSGLGFKNGCFIADITITMGGLKLALFNDDVKDITGEIIVANLGLNSKLYEDNSSFFLLEETDITLPFRNKLSTHKGNYGHLLVVSGEKLGAGILASEAGFALGCGLVSIMTHDDKIFLPPHIMHTHHIPYNLTSVAIGMGLGNFEEDEIKHILSLDIAKVCDADLFYSDVILEVLNDSKCVLTPHPKEFVSLLKICQIDDISVATLQQNRFFYLQKFCKKYPDITILLKGANILIGNGDNIYINTLGSSILSQGGSGDVLSGFIGAYLAQGYTPLHSAINGSLALTLSSRNYQYNNYSLKPQDLIEGVKNI